MIIKKASKTQADEPEYYHTMIEKGVYLISKLPDTWWIVESESSSKKTYLLQIHMKKLVYNGGRNAKNAYGRIECDCPSFVYCKTTPRHCKHSVELARRFFGNRAMQYIVLDEEYRGTIDEPDEWCGENYKMFEALLDKKPREVQQRYRAGKYLESKEVREHNSRLPKWK